MNQIFLKNIIFLLTMKFYDDIISRLHGKLQPIILIEP